jgi:hypothetical protein
MKHLLSSLLVVSAVPVLAGETTVAITPPNILDVETLEEVLIEGERDSLSSARKAIDEAEDRLYARFNELNDSDALDIECRMEAPTGTLLKRRVCEAKGLQDWTRPEVGALLFSTGGTFQPGASESARLSLMAEAKRRMLELLRKDPELLRALLERARLEKHYEELRKEKLKNRWVVWD